MLTQLVNTVQLLLHHSSSEAVTLKAVSVHRDEHGSQKIANTPTLATALHHVCVHPDPEMVALPAVTKAAEQNRLIRHVLFRKRHTVSNFGSILRDLLVNPKLVSTA